MKAPEINAFTYSSLTFTYLQKSSELLVDDVDPYSPHTTSLEVIDAYGTFNTHEFSPLTCDLWRFSLVVTRWSRST